MARPETISRTELTRRLGRVFLMEGYEGASLARLASAAGLAKAALYHRYPAGKEEIALSVLEAASCDLAGGALLALSGPGAPEARLAAMVAAVKTFYEDGARPCLADLFSVGGVPESVRDPIGPGLDAWIAAIADLLGEAGFEPREAAARAEDAVVRIQGALVVSRARGDTGTFRRVTDRLVADLLDRGLEPKSGTGFRQSGAADPMK